MSPVSAPAEPPITSASLCSNSSERFRKAAVLRNAQAALICHRECIIQHGTHSVVFGTVIEASYRPEIQPLLYLDGRYGGFHAG